MTEALKSRNSRTRSPSHGSLLSFQSACERLAGDNLDVTATVTFRSNGMYNAFKQAEQDAGGPWLFPTNGKTATLMFGGKDHL